MKSLKTAPLKSMKAPAPKAPAPKAPAPKAPAPAPKAPAAIPYNYMQMFPQKRSALPFVLAAIVMIAIIAVVVLFATGVIGGKGGGGGKTGPCKNGAKFVPGALPMKYGKYDYNKMQNTQPRKVTFEGETGYCKCPVDVTYNMIKNTGQYCELKIDVNDCSKYKTTNVANFNRTETARRQVCVCGDKYGTASCATYCPYQCNGTKEKVAIGATEGGFPDKKNWYDRCGCTAGKWDGSGESGKCVCQGKCTTINKGNQYSMTKSGPYLSKSYATQASPSLVENCGCGSDSSSKKNVQWSKSTGTMRGNVYVKNGTQNGTQIPTMVEAVYAAATAATEANGVKFTPSGKGYKIVVDCKTGFSPPLCGKNTSCPTCKPNPTSNDCKETCLTKDKRGNPAICCPGCQLKRNTSLGGTYCDIKTVRF